MRGSYGKPLAIVSPKSAKSSSAQPRRLLEHRLEDRREIAGRAVDHLQYLGGRGLPLERLARLRDEARILHRDHRLGGEILKQRDLFLAERPDLRPGGTDVSEQ